jgi:hypothetical protein
MRLRNTELLFGMFLAIAIFTIGMLFPSQSSGQAAQKPAQQESADRSASAPNAEPTGMAWLTKDAAGFFTFILVIVGSLQAILFLAQLRLIRDSLAPALEAADAAKAAAQAAKLNAQSVIDAERAHLYVVVGRHSLTEIQKSAEADVGPGIPSLPVVAPTLSYRFKNYGKTPAILQRVSHGICIQKKQSDARDMETRMRPMEIIGANEFSEEITLEFKRPFTYGDARSLVDRHTTLLFCGEATFLDAFQKHHEIRWEFVNVGGSLHPISGEEKEI